MSKTAFISQYVTPIAKARGFVAVAAVDIPENTIIEIAPVIMLTAKSMVLLSKANSISDLDDKVIIDESVVDKEFDVFMALGEMELESRLNTGQITPDEYQKILRSKINVNALLDAKTHALPLGYGLLYGISDFPNMVREYNSNHKLCLYRAVQYITAGTELTYSK